MARSCLIGLLLACHAYAGAQDPAPMPEPPFGHSHWAQSGTNLDPIPLDIEVERDGEHFWRGRIDGRGDDVILTASSDTGCGDIIVNSSGHSSGPGPMDQGPARLQLRILYQARDTTPAHFQLQFNFERSVPGTGERGQSCDYGIDRRIIRQVFDFPIEPGQTLYLPGNAGIRIRVARK